MKRIWKPRLVTPGFKAESFNSRIIEEARVPDLDVGTVGFGLGFGRGRLV